MSTARTLVPVAALALCAAPALALTSNPIDPSLPLDQHVTVVCVNDSTATTGQFQAHCFGVNQKENPVTLSHVVGTGDGTADLRDGTLRSRSTAQAFWFDQDQLRAGGFADLHAYDTITIEGGFTGTVELRMAIHGSFTSTDANPNVMGSDMVASLLGIDGSGLFLANAGATAFQFNDGQVGLQNQGTNGPATLVTNATGPNQLFDPGDVQMVLSLFVAVTPNAPTFSFVARLLTESALGFTAPVNQAKDATTDFGNTAQLSVIVPAGVTWHSDSGVFLVPEPSALALLALAALCGGPVYCGARNPPGRRGAAACRPRIASNS